MTSPKVELFFESDSQNPMSPFAPRKCVNEAHFRGAKGDRQRRQTKATDKGDRECDTPRALFYGGCLKTPIYGLLEIVYN